MTQEQILTDNNMFTLKVKFFFMKNDKTNYQMWFVLFWNFLGHTKVYE